MADVKELVPEFFYLPEFLVNSNNFDLGTLIKIANFCTGINFFNMNTFRLQAKWSTVE